MPSLLGPRLCWLLAEKQHQEHLHEKVNSGARHKNSTEGTVPSDMTPLLPHHLDCTYGPRQHYWMCKGERAGSLHTEHPCTPLPVNTRQCHINVLSEPKQSEDMLPTCFAFLLWVTPRKTCGWFGEKRNVPCPILRRKKCGGNGGTVSEKTKTFLWSGEKRLEWAWGKDWMTAQLKSPPTFWPSIQASLVNEHHAQSIACIMCSYSHICGSEHRRNIGTAIEDQTVHLVQGLASGQILQRTEKGSCKSLYTICWCAKKTVSHIRDLPFMLGSS